LTFLIPGLFGRLILSLFVPDLFGSINLICFGLCDLVFS
jgi:hypothetical protein